jgi:hypothetical protein
MSSTMAAPTFCDIGCSYGDWMADGTRPGEHHHRLAEGSSALKVHGSPGKREQRVGSKDYGDLLGLNGEQVNHAWLGYGKFSVFYYLKTFLINLFKKCCSYNYCNLIIKNKRIDLGKTFSLCW